MSLAIGLAAGLAAAAGAAGAALGAAAAAACEAGGPKLYAGPALALQAAVLNASSAIPARTRRDRSMLSSFPNSPGRSPSGSSVALARRPIARRMCGVLANYHQLTINL